MKIKYLSLIALALITASSAVACSDCEKAKRYIEKKGTEVSFDAIVKIEATEHEKAPVAGLWYLWVEKNPSDKRVLDVLEHASQVQAHVEMMRADRMKISAAGMHMK